MKRLLFILVILAIFSMDAIAEPVILGDVGSAASPGFQVYFATPPIATSRDADRGGTQDAIDVALASTTGNDQMAAADQNAQGYVAANPVHTSRAGDLGGTQDALDSPWDQQAMTVPQASTDK